jgi:hypothetical protein
MLDSGHADDNNVAQYAACHDLRQPLVNYFGLGAKRTWLRQPEHRQIRQRTRNPD